MPSRVSWLFDVTTNPQNQAIASAHSGGWSESHWTSGSILAGSQFIIDWAVYRARLLPNQASIVGYRIENFTIDGNKLLPGGTSGGRFQYPGGLGTDLNLPQDALQCSGPSATSPNTAKFNLRCIPDSQIINGEFQPTTNYLAALNFFLSVLKNDDWGFIGRIKSTPSARVQSITSAGVITLSVGLGGVQGQSYLRLLRVYDSNGNPVKGTYLATSIAGNVYTCPELVGRVVSVPSGLARIDALAFFSYGQPTIGRACSRKIGRPFEQYRGRRSKTRV